MLVTVAVGTTVTIQKEALCVPGNAMGQAVTHWRFTIETPDSIPDLSMWELYKQSSSGIGFPPGILVLSITVIPPVLHSHSCISYST